MQGANERKSEAQHGYVELLQRVATPQIDSAVVCQQPEPSATAEGFLLPEPQIDPENRLLNRKAAKNAKKNSEVLKPVSP